MKHPLALSVWFICCVSLGLVLAWLDGVSAPALLETAAVAIACGLTLAAAGWLRQRRRK